MFLRFTHDNIVTCSRDGSAIIWIPRSRRSHVSTIWVESVLIFPCQIASEITVYLLSASDMKVLIQSCMLN